MDLLSFFWLLHKEQTLYVPRPKKVDALFPKVRLRCLTFPSNSPRCAVVQTPISPPIPPLGLISSLSPPQYTLMSPHTGMSEPIYLSCRICTHIAAEQFDEA